LAQRAQRRHREEPRSGDVAIQGRGARSVLEKNSPPSLPCDPRVSRVPSLRSPSSQGRRGAIATNSQRHHRLESVLLFSTLPQAIEKYLDKFEIIAILGGDE
jgi:hypothetical protein